MRGLKGKKKKNLVGVGEGDSVTSQTMITTEAKDLHVPAEMDQTWTVKKKGKFPIYNKTRTVIINSNTVTVMKGEKKKMEVDLSACVTPIFHDKDCKITIKGNKTCEFKVKKEEYQMLKACVEMILKQGKTIVSVKEKERIPETTVRPSKPSIQTVAEEEMSLAVKAESTEKNQWTLQRLTDEGAFLENDCFFTFEMHEEKDIISRELFWGSTRNEDPNHQTKQITIKYTQMETVVKDNATKLDVKAIEFENVASNSKEMVMKSWYDAAEPNKNVVKSGDEPAENIVTSPYEIVMNPGDVVTTPGKRVVESGYIVTAPDEIVAESGDIVTAPDEIAVEPGYIVTVHEKIVAESGDIATTPDEMVAESEDVVSTPDDIVMNPEGVVTTPDEIVMNPEGVVTTPNEIFMNPEGVVTTPDEIVMNPEGVVTTPDEIVMNPEGVVTTPDEIVMNPEGVVTTPDEIFARSEDAQLDDNILEHKDKGGESKNDSAKDPEIVRLAVPDVAENVESVKQFVVNNGEPDAIKGMIRPREKKTTDAECRKHGLPKVLRNIKEKVRNKLKRTGKGTTSTNKEDTLVSKAADVKSRRGNLNGSDKFESTSTTQENEGYLIEEVPTEGCEKRQKEEYTLERAGGEEKGNLTQELASVEEERELTDDSTVSHDTICETDLCPSVKKTILLKRKMFDAKQFVKKKLSAVRDLGKKAFKTGYQKVVEILKAITSTKTPLKNTSETEVKCIERKADEALGEDEQPNDTPSSPLVVSSGNGRKSSMLKKAFFVATIYTLIEPVSGCSYTEELSSSDWCIYIVVPAVIGFAGLVTCLGDDIARHVMNFLVNQLGRFYINGGDRAVWVRVYIDGIYLAEGIVVLEPPHQRFIMTAEEEQQPTINNQELVISN